MKIFGIGLERTGTTSLAAAMLRLGFTTCHLPRSTNEIDPVDFANDITVACRYQELDRKYPGSKFILTTRDEESWLKSCARWYGHLDGQGICDFTAEAAAMRLYSEPHFSEVAWRAGREQHETNVGAYFADRPGDLLVLDICGGQGWAELLPFVAPAMGAFPLENVFAGLRE